jgi:prepilin-type N-terminal cleavage/methylation domain-containing protein
MKNTKNNGFSLVELLGVIIILGIISLITVPIISTSIKHSRQSSLDTIKNSVKNSTINWIADNMSITPENENDSITINLDQLKRQTYIDNKIMNPVTGDEVSNDSQIVITNINNNYDYDVLFLDTIEAQENVTSDKPSIILNSKAVYEVTLNSTFVDPGAILYTEGIVTEQITTASKIESVTLENSMEALEQAAGAVVVTSQTDVASVSTSSYGSYRLTYTRTGDYGTTTNTAIIIIN